MPKHQPKTRANDLSVEDFLNSVENETRRSDAFKLLEIFRRVTGEKPTMWGTAIVGFGSSPIKYADGNELDWPMTGFSPRKQNLTLYVINSSPQQPRLLAELGPHTTSRACLYIKRLSDVNEKVLEHVIRDCVEHERSVMQR
jgi:hypothetical protein